MPKTNLTKKILLVLDWLEPSGPTRINQDLTHIYNRNVDYYLLAGNFTGETDLLNEFNLKKSFIYPLPQANSLTIYLRNIFQSFLSVGKIIRNEKIDTIVLNLHHSALGVLLNPITWSKKKLFIFHGSWDLEKNSSTNSYRFKNHLEYWLTRFVLVWVNRVLVFSDYAGNLVATHYHISPHRIQKIVPILKSRAPKILPRADSNTPTYSLLIPSRIEPRKGIHLVVEAAYFLKKWGYQHIQYNFTGEILDPAYFQDTILQIRSNDLFPYFRFLPTQSRQNLFSCYNQSDLVLLPSVKLETLGLITLESLQSHVPVLAFNSGASPEILNLVSPRLVINKIDGQSLARRIKWYVDLDAKNKQLLRDKCAVINDLVDNRQLQSQLDNLFSIQTIQPTKS